MAQCCGNSLKRTTPTRGLIDRSLIPLFNAPLKNGSYYWTRKGFNAIAKLLICDKNRNLIFRALVNRLPRIGVLTPKHTQRPGDGRVDVAVWSSGQDFGPPVFWEWELQNLHRLGVCHDRDSCFCFQTATHGQLTKEQHRFNYLLAQNHVQIKCCIGALKGRFQSLKGLRLRIGDGRDQIRALDAWIMACGVLHNFLNQGDDFDSEDQDLNPGVHIPRSEVQSTSGASTQRATVAGRLQREKVKAQALASNQ
ncbi:hypothetical protein PSTT_02899 [Puccinia striiformis]|uniref:DDE Tnp4 domain-containing protein n=1 Tax=Puccinia striiformis TaxID=27350 RepID=A0A2S4VYA8_9BASI|nr:hypothetical protein PSTT_02899 [Puccinia striiformis]